MCPGNMEPAGFRLRSLLARPSRQPGRPNTWDCDRNPLRIPTSHHDARPTPTVNTRPGPTRMTRLQLRPIADGTTWPPRFGLCEPRTYYYHPPPLAVLRRGQQTPASPPTRRQWDGRSNSSPAAAQRVAHHLACPLPSLQQRSAHTSLAYPLPSLQQRSAHGSWITLVPDSFHRK